MKPRGLGQQQSACRSKTTALTSSPVQGAVQQNGESVTAVVNGAPITAAVAELVHCSSDSLPFAEDCTARRMENPSALRTYTRLPATITWSAPE